MKYPFDIIFESIYGKNMAYDTKFQLEDLPDDDYMASDEEEFDLVLTDNQEELLEKYLDDNLTELQDSEVDMTNEAEEHFKDEIIEDKLLDSSFYEKDWQSINTARIFHEEEKEATALHKNWLKNNKNDKKQYDMHFIKDVHLGNEYTTYHIKKVRRKLGKIFVPWLYGNMNLEIQIKNVSDKEVWNNRTRKVDPFKMMLSDVEDLKTLNFIDDINFSEEAEEKVHFTKFKLKHFNLTLLDCIDIIYGYNLKGFSDEPEKVLEYSLSELGVNEYSIVNIYEDKYVAVWSFDNTYPDDYESLSIRRFKIVMRFSHRPLPDIPVHGYTYFCKTYSSNEYKKMTLTYINDVYKQQIISLQYKYFENNDRLKILEDDIAVTEKNKDKSSIDLTENNELLNQELIKKIELEANRTIDSINQEIFELESYKLKIQERLSGLEKEINTNSEIIPTLDHLIKQEQKEDIRYKKEDIHFAFSFFRKKQRTNYKDKDDVKYVKYEHCRAYNLTKQQHLIYSIPLQEQVSGKEETNNYRKVYNIPERTKRGKIIEPKKDKLIGKTCLYQDTKYEIIDVSMNIDYEKNNNFYKVLTLLNKQTGENLKKIRFLDIKM